MLFSLERTIPPSSSRKGLFISTPRVYEKASSLLALVLAPTYPSTGAHILQSFLLRNSHHKTREAPHLSSCFCWGRSKRGEILPRAKMSSGPLPPHTSYQDSFRFTENCKDSRECFYLLHTTFLIAAAFYLSQVRNQHWSVTISQTLDVIHIFLVSSHLSLFCFRIALIVYYISPSHPLRPLWSMMASQFPLFFMEFSVFRTVGQIILYGDPLFGLI